MTTFNSLQKIGYQLRFYRRQLGLTQNQMAEELGISSRNLQRIEMSEIEPKLETLYLIANYLKISVSSLLRPTTEMSLNIACFSTIKELHHFKEQIEKANPTDDILLAKKLLIKDHLEKIDGKSNLIAGLEGSIVTLSEDLSALTGLATKGEDINRYVKYGTATERWELVFRAKLTQAVIQNQYIFPKGMKVFEEYHYNLKPNPDAPTSECYIRDITHRHDLETWLKINHGLH